MPSAAPCPDLQALRQFLAGEASDSAEAFLERHLLDCPDCVKRLEAVEDDSALLKVLREPADEPNPDLQPLPAIPE